MSYNIIIEYICILTISEGLCLVAIVSTMICIISMKICKVSMMI